MTETIGLAFLVLSILSFIECYAWRNLVSKPTLIYIALVSVLFFCLFLFFDFGIKLPVLIVTISAAMIKFYLALKAKNSIGANGGGPSDLYAMIGYLSTQMKEIQIDYTAMRAANLGHKQRGVIAMSYEGEFKYVNSAFASIFDKEIKWFKTKTFKDVVSPDEYARSMEYWENNKDKNLKGFVNTWTIDGNNYVLKWVDIYNDNKDEVTYCVAELVE